MHPWRARSPGRFTTVSPGGVELDMDFDLMSEMLNRVVLSLDSSTVRHVSPNIEEVTSGLLLDGRGDNANPYVQTLDSCRSWSPRNGQNFGPSYNSGTQTTRR